MAFPTTSAQQAETNRKILEDIQHKKQLLQKSVGAVPLTPGGIGIIGLTNTIPNSPTLNQQMPAPQLLGQGTLDFQQQAPNASSAVSSPRTAFNPTSSTTLGFFIPQDSYFGNSFLPVLPRLDPLPAPSPPNHNPTK